MKGEIGSMKYPMLKGYCLTTAEITYRMPDHPSVLQTFVWQTMDRPPDYPRLVQFLGYWQANLDAELHCVRIAGTRSPKPSEWHYLDQPPRLLH